jgi:hypothetical protein
MLNIMEKFPKTDFAGMNDKPTIIEKLQESKEKYKEAIAHGKELRHEFLLERANIAHQNGNLTMEAAIKQLAHIEATIQTYASIKKVMHRSTYQPGLTSIRIPMEDRSYKTMIIRMCCLNGRRPRQRHLVEGTWATISPPQAHWR